MAALAREVNMQGSLFRRYSRIALAVLFGVAAGGCQGNVVNPTAPTVSSMLAPGTTTSAYGGQAVALIAMPGSLPAGGSGIINDPQTAQPGFNNFQLTVTVHGGPPDTDLFFQFVADIARATRGDGVCPTSFPDPPANTIQVLHTSPGGTATAHIKFGVPEGFFDGTFDSGEKADFKWRVVNSAQTFDLQTPCVVLTGK
jgi:hypothetical protein